MHRRTRRQFFADVGKGMVAATLGTSLAADLGFRSAFALQGADALSFGALEPLVGLMQDTHPDRLLPLLVDRLRAGGSIEELLAAGTLANARSFGGEDYVGFHTMMALAPAYYMSRELPPERQAIPVLKVLYRNSKRIQETGGRSNEVLHVAPSGTGVSPVDSDLTPPEALRDAVRRAQMDEAEGVFAGLAAAGPGAAFNDLLWTVQDATEVHRVVLPYRAWDLVGLIGEEHAHTLLRQSVRFCVAAERNPNYAGYWAEIRALLPRLLDQYALVGRELGTREADDAWIEETAMAIFSADPAQAAETAAAVLADGMAPDALGEAISLATNQLVLRDNGRTEREAQPNKPVGSVHGDSIGVHACDSANAWRNMARVANPRNCAVNLVLAAYQAARDRVQRGGDFLNWEPYPRADAREALTASEPEQLLQEADAAIRAGDQARAAAAVHRYGEYSSEARPVFDLLLGHATRDDGALHGEKYYRTVTEEFHASRPAFRWRQLVALARVVASAHGQTAEGYNQACDLLAQAH